MFEPQLNEFFAPIPHKEFITLGLLAFAVVGLAVSEHRKDQEARRRGQSR